MSKLVEALSCIADKDKTYANGVEFAVYLARACLNVHAACDYRIPEKYQYLVEEMEEE